jgi:hypothetical protein
MDHCTDRFWPKAIGRRVLGGLMVSGPVGVLLLLTPAKASAADVGVSPLLGSVGGVVASVGSAVSGVANTVSGVVSTVPIVGPTLQVPPVTGLLGGTNPVTGLLGATNPATGLLGGTNPVTGLLGGTNPVTGLGGSSMPDSLSPPSAIQRNLRTAGVTLGCSETAGCFGASVPSTSPSSTGALSGLDLALGGSADGSPLGIKSGVSSSPPSPTPTPAIPPSRFPAATVTNLSESSPLSHGSNPFEVLPPVSLLLPTLIIAGVCLARGRTRKYLYDARSPPPG